MTSSLKMAKLDFFTVKPQFKVYLILVGIVVYFAAMGSSIITLCITCSWFMALIASNIFAIQEKNNLNRLYGSLSIRSNEIVLGRYIFVSLSHILSVAILIIVYFIVALFQGTPIELQNVLLGFSLSFLAFSTIAGAQMPLFFKMSYTKARIWSLVPFIAVMGLFILPSFEDALTGIMELLMSNENVLIICCILISCIIQFLSYNISVAVYRKR